MTTQVLGQVRSVSDQTAGSELSADAAIGQTLTVEDLEWVSESGGALLVGTDARSYDTVDFTANTVHLTTATSQIWPTGTRVEPNPTSINRYIEVWTESEDYEDDPEALTARVPNVFRDRMPIGTREADAGEYVIVEREGDVEGEWVFVDFPGEDMVVTLESVDPATIPHTDGFPPSTSPTPTLRSGAGALVVQWPGVANADPTEYEVHVSTSPSFTPVPGDPTTLAGTIAASMLWVRELPLDGSKLLSTVTYYVRLISSDADGTAAPGPVASGSPGQAGEDDILAGAVTAEKLEGVLAILGSIILGAVDSDGNPIGQHVRGDANGLVLKSASGVPLVTLPTDPSQSPTFAGEVVAGALTVVGNAILRGKTTIDRGGTLVLGDGVSDPETAPTVTMDWPTQDLYPTDSANTTYRYGLLLDGSDLYVGMAFPNSSRVVKTTLAGAYVTSVAFLGAGYTLRGVTKVGTDFYVLALNLSSGQHVVFRHNASWSPTASFPVSSVGMNAVPALGTDGTNLLVGYRNASSFMEVRKYTITGTLSSTTSTNVISPESQCTGILQGNFDLGAARWVFGTIGHLYVTDTAGVRQINEEWEMPVGGVGGAGIIWDSGNALGFGVVFVQASRVSKKLVAHTPWIWTTASANYYTRYSWYDSNAAGTGTHETNVSPFAFISLYKRSRLTVVIPAIPVGAGSNDDPNSARIYMVPKSTPPILSDFKLQATPTVTATALTTYNGAGAAPPVASNFPASSPAELRSGPLFNSVPLLRGNGVPRVRLEYTAGGNCSDLNEFYVRFGTKTVDTDGFYGTPTDAIAQTPDSTYNVVIPFNGQYQIIVTNQFAGNTVGRRDIGVQKNGSVSVIRHTERSHPEGGTPFRGNLVYVAELVASDYLRFSVIQSSGGVLSLGNMRVTILYVGPT